VSITLILITLKHCNYLYAYKTVTCVCVCGMTKYVGKISNFLVPINCWENCKKNHRGYFCHTQYTVVQLRVEHWTYWKPQLVVAKWSPNSQRQQKYISICQSCS